MGLKDKHFSSVTQSPFQHFVEKLFGFSWLWEQFLPC